MKRSRQIYLSALGLVLGILYAQFYPFSLDAYWLALLILCVLVIFTAKSRLGYAAFFVAAFALGAWRMSVAIAPVHPNIDDYHFKKVTVVGTVAGEPFWNSQRDYQYYLSNLSVNSEPIAGQLKVKSQIGSACEGCVLAVTGKVWPSLGKATSQMSYAKPAVISTQKNVLLQLKNEFNRGLRHTLSAIPAAFMEGILVGARTQLPKDIQDNLNAVGLSHIVAVSGYNLTILVAAFAFLLRKKWKWASLVGSLSLIVCFVIITGAGASVVRAAIMASIFLLGIYAGRGVRIEVCLALGLIVTLILSPTQLTGDLSWQLSFLSLSGIVFISPKILAILPKRGGLGVISEILAITLAAQLATLPLLAYAFGRISIVAPLANLIIMPLVPLLMLIGFGSGILGIIVPQLAVYFGGLVDGVVNHILNFVYWLARISWASSLVKITLSQVVSMYAVLFILALTRHAPVSKNRLISGIIGDSKRESYVGTQ